MKTMLRCLISLAVPLAGASAQDSTLVIGSVVSREGLPLPYSTYTVTPGNIHRFTNSDGVFSLRLTSGRSVRIVIKQLGYRALDTTLTISAASPRVTLRFAMWGMAYRLAAVRAVAHKACDVDIRTTELGGILEEVSKNAEREQLLRQSYAFEYRLERNQRSEWSGGVSRYHRDTLVFLSSVWDPYTAGQVVRAGITPSGFARDMRIPQLTDFSNEGFLENHCFFYGGIEKVRGVGAYRIDFSPGKDVRTADVAGSVLLDTATLVIRRAVFSLTGGESLSPPVLSLDVTTTYHDLFKGVAIFDHIRSVQLFPHARPTDASQVQIEDQKLVGVIFLGRSPNDSVVHASITPTFPLVAQPSTTPVLTSVVGAVVDSGDNGIAMATVRNAAGVELARSDSLGRFSISTLPPGSSRLTVRALGYAPAEFSIGVGGRPIRHFKIVLNRNGVLLETIVVTEPRIEYYLTQVGFTERSRTLTGRGTFIGLKELMSKRGVYTTDFLLGVNSVEIRDGLPYANSGLARIGSRIGSHPSCLMNLYVDGNRVELDANGARLDDVVAPGEVGAIEVYPTGASTPPQFTGISRGCGTLVIWTKTKLASEPPADSTHSR